MWKRWRGCPLPLSPFLTRHRLLYTFLHQQITYSYKRGSFPSSVECRCWWKWEWWSRPTVSHLLSQPVSPRSAALAAPTVPRLIPRLGHGHQCGHSTLLFPSTPHFLSFIFLLCLSLYAKLSPPSLSLSLHHCPNTLFILLCPASLFLSLTSSLLPILLSFLLCICLVYSQRLPGARRVHE